MSFDPFLPTTGTIQLIEASAGTGKTHSLTSLYLRLFLESTLEIDQLLVVTFTEAATAELRERIRARLRAALRAFLCEEKPSDPFMQTLLARCQAPDLARRRLLAASSDLDRASIFTIHGFCQRMLKRHALEAGVFFDLELSTSTDELLRRILDDYWAKSLYPPDPHLSSLAIRDLSLAELPALAAEVLRRGEAPISVDGLPDLDSTGLSARRDHLLNDFYRCYAKARNLFLKDDTSLSEYFASATGLRKPFIRLLEAGLIDSVRHFLQNPKPESFIPPRHSELLSAANILQLNGKVFTNAAINKGPSQPPTFTTVWGRLIELSQELARTCRATFLLAAAEYCRKELPTRLLAARQQTFDQLLSSLASALLAPGGQALADRIRSLFPIALIDEFQDTDPTQAAIFKTIYGPGGSLFLIGDPKQAIYSFRGADIQAYLDVAEHAAQAFFTMDTNFRSDPGLIGAINHLFGEDPTPFLNARLPFRPVRPRPGATDLWSSAALGSAPLQFLTLPAAADEASSPQHSRESLSELIPQKLAGEIARLLDGGACLAGEPVRPGDVAVLVRTNRQAEQIQEALRDREIASVLHSRASVFKSAEAEECLRLLRAILRPGDSRLLKTALATVTLGAGAADLDQLDRRPAALDEAIGRFEHWQDLWRKNGIMAMLLALLRESGAIGRLLHLVDGKRRLTNLRHLGELLEQAEQEHHFSPEQLTEWLLAATRGVRDSESAELRLESDEEAVRLVTIHRSKGLQYPVVYCPYLTSRSTPRKAPLFAVVHDRDKQWQGKILLMPEDATLAQAEEEAFAEELRLLYVALTRARHCCLVLWDPVKNYEKSALAYLVHSGLADQENRNDLGRWRQFLAGLDRDTLAEDLRQRANRTSGWLVRPLAQAPEGFRPRPVAGAKLRNRAAVRKFDRSFRISSFSGLTTTPLHRNSQEWPEHWLEREQATILPLLRPEENESSDRTRLALASFPKGAGAGNFFHCLLERLSFAEVETSKSLAELVDGQLAFHGYDREIWSLPIRKALAALLATPLGQSGFSLRDIPDHKRLNEMPFHLPVGDPGREDEAPFNPGLLAGAFEKYPAGLPADYPARLAALGFAPLRAYLKGFVDLIFEQDGKWYLVDYKSNHLGAYSTDYRPKALLATMAEHHYVLQYHLYTVALDRYLRLRLPGYRYEKNFGGVFSLFIRGMQPDDPEHPGIFFDLPPVERIRAISNLFDPENRELQDL